MPITARVCWKVTRDRRAKMTVIHIMMGRTMKLTSANGILSTTIATTIPTSEKTLPITCVNP